MPTHRTATFSELSAALERGKAKLRAPQVHALLLGGLTSTRPDFSPLLLLRHIFGESEGSAADVDLPAMSVVLDYWNHLIAERDAERTRLTPYPLAEDATIDALRAHAAHRHDEIEWFLRGLLIGEDEDAPVPSAVRKDCLHHVVDLSSIFARLAEPDDDPPPAPEHLHGIRSNQLKSEELAERFIAVLLDDTEYRRQTELRDLAEDRGSETRTPARRGPRIGRNEPCPCGSGKKWKRCCGNLATAQ